MKSYKHGFAKNATGAKSRAKSSFDRFFVHRLENSKYWPFPMSMGDDARKTDRNSTSCMTLNKFYDRLIFSQNRARTTCHWLIRLEWPVF
ncbi:hypothetical protein BHM03_00021960 [Ensete ventricosum]|nr:hypothetical protein BHM03_00021960 [Ensete ventricosum]